MRRFLATRLGVATMAVGLVAAPGMAARALAQPTPDPPLTLEHAVSLARENSQTLRAALGAAGIAKEDRVQARSAFLPSVSAFSQYIHTQENGTPSGVFVSADGPKVYSLWATVHADLFSPAKWAGYRASGAAEEAARADAEVAARGLVSTVVESYYDLVAATRRVVSARQGLSEAQNFLQITTRQEAGGEVAHSDVVKAQIEVGRRERDEQEAELGELKSRLGLSVLVFPDFRDNITVADDLATEPPLPDLEVVRSMAGEHNVELKAAQASLREQSSNIAAARDEFLPSISLDYFYGIDANQFATYDPYHNHLVGSQVQAQVTLPLWNWGATASKVRQARIREDQARGELSLVERQLLANLATFYAEAQAASRQAESLRSLLDLSTESLRLTLLRYQAGEVSVLEVVDAQSTLIEARSAYDEGLVRYRVSLAALQTLTGTF